MMMDNSSEVTNEPPSTDLSPPSISSEDSEVERLKTQIQTQSNEMNELQGRLHACQQHYETLITRLKEENAREKQLNVMRYAQAEKAKLDADKRYELFNAKNLELSKEKENLQMKLAELKTINGKLQQAYDAKLAELNSTKKEFEKIKELNQSMDATLKSTLNHLKGESAHLREQREMNERLKKELQEQKDLNEQMKNQCQQLNEALQAVPTDDERAQALETLKEEHNALKAKLVALEEENHQWKEKFKSVDEDRLALENVLENFRQNALKEKETRKKLYDDLLAAREEDLTEMSRLKQIEGLYNQTLADNADLRQLLEKEHEFLALTQSLTEKNSILQSDYEQIRTSFEQISKEHEDLLKITEEQKRRLIEFEENQRSLKDQLKELQEKHQSLTQSYEEVRKENEDKNIEIINLKKKHQANTKDLIKQLQQFQKAKNTQQHDDGTSSTNSTKVNPSKETTADNTSSRGSRTSSTGSLNETNSSTEQSLVSSSNASTVVSLVPPEESDVVVNIVDIDRQKLIDKLIKQQKLLVRRNEKIEFLNDHIQLLTQDLQNKRKIIQSYAMNADGFMYTSNESDAVKQQLAQKSRSSSSSFMGTLYNRATTVSHHASNKLLPQFFHDQSSPMTLETALDIMGKLQSVLEDTLLKNITLKENVDTLSKEIERLSKRTNH